MATDRLARFKRQQVSLEPRPAVRRHVPAAFAGNADVFDAFVADNRAVRQRLDAPLDTGADVANLLGDLRRRWSDEAGAALRCDMRLQAVTAVAASFGLGTVVAAYDKRGGNVTTRTTARDGVYADGDAYQRGDYAGSRYKRARARHLDAHTGADTGEVRDVYSGAHIADSEADCDHIIAAKAFHADGGFMLSREDRAAFGADAGNLALTSSKANRSLGAQDKLAWGARAAVDGSGQTNKQVHGHDNRRVGAALKRGRAAAAAHAPNIGTESRYYATRLASSGAAEAAKGGLQQALAVLVTEFLTACFDEVEDAWSKKAETNDGWLASLAARFKRVVKRVAARWEAAWAALQAGALSALLSNLATVMVNLLFTTAKKIARIVRDGFLAIARSLHALLYPPDGIDPAQARQAALNLLVAAIVAALGATVGELVEKGLQSFCAGSMPVLVPFVPYIAGAITAVGTALVSCLAVRTIEGLDLFGAAAGHTHRQVMATLDDLIVGSDARIDALFAREARRLAV